MNGIMDRLFPASPMMGLLGEDQQQLALQQARQQGLLGLAAGLLQAGGPSRTRTNLGQAIGSGLLAGQQMYQQALNQQLQGQVTMEKLGEARRLREQQAMARQLMPQLVTTERQQALTTGSQAADPLAALIKSADAGTLNQPTINQVAANTLRSLLPPADFAKVMDSIKTQFEIAKPPEVKSPFAAVDPSKYTPESLRQFSKSKDYSDLRLVDQADAFTGEYANIARSQFGTANLSQLTPQQRVAIGNAAMQSAASQAPQINMPAENAILNKVVVPRIASLNEEAASARNIAQASETINNLLKGAGGGGLVKLTADAQRFLGIKSDTASRDDLAQALATQTAVGVRATGSGATSDLEFKAYLAAVPSLSRTEDGRQFMADYARRRARRAAQLADYAQKLAMENRYSEMALQDYDEKLGALLGEEEKNKFLPQLSPTSARGVARRSGLIAD